MGKRRGARSQRSDGEPYRLEWTRDALRRLARLPRNRREQVRMRVAALAADPRGVQLQAKPLKGRLLGVFRLRIGEWRLVYKLDHVQRLVIVLKLEPGHDA